MIMMIMIKNNNNDNHNNHKHKIEIKKYCQIINNTTKTRKKHEITYR